MGLRGLRFVFLAVAFSDLDTHWRCSSSTHHGFSHMWSMTWPSGSGAPSSLNTRKMRLWALVAVHPHPSQYFWFGYRMSLELGQYANAHRRQRLPWSGFVRLSLRQVASRQLRISLIGVERLNRTVKNQGRAPVVTRGAPPWGTSTAPEGHESSAAGSCERGGAYRPPG